VTVAKGTKVVWTNTSDAAHTITPDTANAFTASSTVAEDQTYSFVFTTAGTFSYHCSIHSYMKATITVTSSPSMTPQ
jgi:plastocyanin